MSDKQLSERQAYRASLLHFIDDPSQSGENAYQYFEDGILVVADGYIEQIGSADELLPKLDITVAHFQNCLITPGFIDTHVHYAQLDIIASHGKQLLDWLNDYTFPAEAKFADTAHAEQVAELFLAELLRNGTTTAAVFCTVHKASVDAFFSAVQARGLRMIAGKVMMDRHAPDYLLDTAVSSYTDCQQLIERWHQQQRLLYAVTPRFAPTSTPEQLSMAGRLLKEYPEVYLQTHLAENLDEINWVNSLFPDCRYYLDVYDKFALLGPRSIFAHGIYLHDAEYQRLLESNSSIAVCPTSNLFIGSGLFDFQQAQQRQLNITLGTDVGGGTSLSLLRTLSEAYKVAQLKQHNLTALQMFYWLTLGAARALQLQHYIGSFGTGLEADFVILDYQATPLLARRLAQADTLEEKLFALIMLADDRAIRATYSAGQQVHAV